MRRFTLEEGMTLLILSGRIRDEIDPTLGDLIERVAGGDESALVPAVDRLKELGREEQAERLKRLVKGKF